MVPGLGSQGVVAKDSQWAWRDRLGWEPWFLWAVVGGGPWPQPGPGLLMSWGLEWALGGAQPAWHCSRLYQPRRPAVRVTL